MYHNFFETTFNKNNFTNKAIIPGIQFSVNCAIKTDNAKINGKKMSTESLEALSLYVCYWIVDT